MALLRRWLCLELCLLLAAAVVLLSLRPAGWLRDDLRPIVRESTQGLVEKSAWRWQQRFTGTLPGAGATALVERWQALERGDPEREALRPLVETVLEHQLEQVLRATLPEAQRFGILLPPPRLRLTDPPYLLVVSPRDRLRITRTEWLGRGLSPAEQSAIERDVEREQPDQAALVVPLGGFAASYPAPIVPQAHLRDTLDLSAHEWLHQHLFLTSELGRAYFRDAFMQQLNETTANLAGRELGLAMYVRFYVADEAAGEALRDEFFDALRRLADEPDAPPATPADDDPRMVLQATRDEVERLLAAGDIAGAEALMRRRERELRERGFPIRRLNQAYLAFYGNYADQPGQASQLGRDLARLRLQASSPAMFIAWLRPVRSQADFERLLETKLPNRKRDSGA